MANIGTTIAPWMVFFQQSSVVDKGMTEKDIIFGKFDTAVGAFFTILVALGCVILTGTLLYKPGGVDIESAAQAAIAIMGNYPIVGSALAIGLFDAGLLGAICISLASSWAMGEVFGWAHSINQQDFRGAYVLCLLFPEPGLRWHSCTNPRSSVGADNPFCTGDSCYSSSSSSGFSYTSTQQ